MIRTFATLLLVPLLAGVPFAALADEAPDVSPAALEERLQGDAPPLVLDVRTPAEFQTGHIPGALNIPHNELVSRIGEVDADNGVVVHCAVGPRARIAEGILMDAGVGGVEHLDGGMNAWKAAGLPVEK